MPRLPRHGVRLHIEAHGQGPAILLTHGFGATCRMWDEQVEEFTGHYRTLLWDLPGHGESGPPANATSLPNLVNDMSVILDAADAKRAVLIGLGLGGLLSLLFWRAYPAMVRGLVLIGTLPGLSSAPARALWNAHVSATAEALEREGLSALEGGAEADPRLHAAPEALAAAARALLTQNDPGALPFLAEIDVPTLILTGSEDKPNLTAAAHMGRVIPNARAHVIPRANHAANLHKPDAVNVVLREFLTRLPE